MDGLPDSERQQVTGTKRIVFMALAGLFFVLGALGAVLPVLPTTPFLLLASYFLTRTSPRMNELLLRSRFFGPILKDWQLMGGVRTDVKVQAIVLVLLTATLSIWLTDPSPAFRWAIGIVTLIGIGVILRLPTAKTDRDAQKS